MKLALIGRSVQHSKSPELYRKIIGSDIEYDLLDFEEEKDLPTIGELSEKYDGVNITSPYKSHYVNDVIIENHSIQDLRAINTIAFNSKKAFATNTDIVAIDIILKRCLSFYPHLSIILLGSGVMAQLTLIVAKKLNLTVISKSRASGDNMNFLDLKSYYKDSEQTLIINACSRQYIFQGTLHPKFIFWDYNYNFDPHQKTLPLQVSSYQDGQEMLKLQADAAANFWLETNSKLKC